MGVVPLSFVKIDPPKKNEEYQSGWTPLITSFWFDGVSENDPTMTKLMALLAEFYKFGSETFQKLQTEPYQMEPEISKMLGTGKVTMYDGVGEVLETWTFYQMWPHSVNFGDLCYSSDPSFDIEITWRFKECDHIIHSVTSCPAPNLLDPSRNLQLPPLGESQPSMSQQH
jgi:hypothetical protein